MKRYVNQIKQALIILTGVIALSSCKENVFQAEDFKSGLYFINDSTDYSFGITPLEIKSHDLEIPVQVMGSPTSQDREYQVKVIAENTTAKEKVHYEIPTTLTIKADSVKGILPLHILREPLGTDFFKVTFSIVETESFIPVSQSMSKIVITFNNRIEQPHWINPYSGSNAKVWPTSKLGPWNPLVYVKFMELFALVEQTAPNAYDNIVAAYGGPLLPNFPGTWAYDYDATLTKYVLIPLYRYFTIEHPELGVKTVPKPAGFVN